MPGNFIKWLLASIIAAVPCSRADEAEMKIGVASVDITPSYGVRLNGFGGRRTESEGVTQPIFAKALAISDPAKGPAVLVTVDNLGVSMEILQEVTKRLEAKAKLNPKRFSITATHTHTAPMLKGVSPTVFGVDIPAEHQANIDRYTREFTDKVEQAALAALNDLKPSTLAWSIGTVGFAKNRRANGGPVDHDLPVLVIKNPDGKVRAVYFSYACHCVTLGDNKISGDWAGFAQAAIEKDFPGAIALASIGCGADANPSSKISGTPVEKCADQGHQIASEVKRLLNTLKPIQSLPDIHTEQIDLPFDKPRTRAQWEERAKSGDYAVAYHAKLNLARLDRGETLPTKMTYLVQTWVFGEDLAMVFLPGETVVDYSLRLKMEFDRNRLWVNGYSNEERCYVPSERILREGGYEGGDAMIYYDRPQRFAPGMEQRIIDIVHRQIPKSYLAPKGTEGIAPVSPQQSLKMIRTKPGLEVEFVAHEPVIVDPVAIDWGADGKLWVCEMHDYPTGIDGNWQPGGRIKFLEDKNGDGFYEKATLFMENLPFPTGVTAWGKGVYLCAAPDLLYAEDTNNDGKADKIEKIFTGFSTENYQARLNSLCIGLDNWIYGANGLLGGVIHGISQSGQAIDIRNRDFRFDPFTKDFEPVSGLTQYGRVRDDWGNWFGCNNSEFLNHFPHNERYAQRNPSVSFGAANVYLPSDRDSHRIFPTSRLQERYNDFDNANRATSAGGLGLYRDTLLGQEYYGNAFTGETVHNVVHREIIEGDGVKFTSRRASDEKQSEFLSSSDNWFRPAQIRTGPDGALYVVDFYRFLIEHPRWIAAKRLAEIDVRAGSDKGRIYRIKPTGKSLRPIRDLGKMRIPELVAALDSPNGTERDRVHIELLSRRDKSAATLLLKLASSAKSAQVRVQAFSVSEAFAPIKEENLLYALKDSDAHVRQNALRLAESVLAKRPSEKLVTAILSLTNDSSRALLHQLAYTLGESKKPQAAGGLIALATAHPNDAELRRKILTSATPHAAQLLAALGSRPDWRAPLLATIANSGSDADLKTAFDLVLKENGPANFENLAQLLARSVKYSDPRLEKFIQEARAIAFNASASEIDRESALKLLSKTGALKQDFGPLSEIAATNPSKKLRAAALNVLRQSRDATVANELLSRWKQAGPTIRSELLPIFLERPEWTAPLLLSIKEGVVQSGEIPAADRQRILNSDQASLRELASTVFPKIDSTQRDSVLKQYANIKLTDGKPAAGAEIFANSCAVCHAFKGVGQAVGPDLAALRDKDVDYFVKNILDPNAIVEPRFVAYNVDLKDDRSILGIIKSESASGLTLITGGGQTENVAPASIKEIQASNLSLMPEGLEQAISLAQMADLLAYIKSVEPKAGVSAEVVLRNPASVAEFVLDEKQPSNLRENAINTNPQFAGDLIAELTRDLTPGTPEEYRRIPWIWRVAIASGKRNEAEQLRRILEVSLPKENEPLHDWQAVVIGGGVINGISQRNQWPAERIAAIIGSDKNLQARWARSLDLAAAMTDNTKVPSGTRYDALRILGVEPWSKRGSQLGRYLTDKNSELQMGAVSGLVDVNSPEATQALIEFLPTLTPDNKRLAIDGLLRDSNRVEALLSSISSGHLDFKSIAEPQAQRLLNHPDEKLRLRALQLSQK